MNTSASASSARLLPAALRQGQERYFARCHRRIPGFIARHLSLRGAARRYYPPRPLEIARLALSVALTPFMAVVQLILWPVGQAQNPTWLAIKAAVSRFTLPRAHAMLAAAVQDEVFAENPDSPLRKARELEKCVVSSPSFALYLRAAVAERYPGMPQAKVHATARALIPILRAGTPLVESRSFEGREELVEMADHVRQVVNAADIRGDLDSVVAGEAARSDVINTILTGIMAKLALGQMKLGAYGIALMVAPALYFRWSSGREEKVRRAIDGLLPDGRWSLSRAGWNFDWTDSFESVALMISLFLGVSAILSVVGYLLAPLLAPVWRITGLPAMSLRRAVEASRKKIVGGPARQSFSPELLAAKAGDLAELFSRSG